MKIPIAKPSFDENEMQAILEPIKTGWVSQGPKVEEFENVFKAYIGTRYACAVNSGTTGLHLALLASGIGSGEEVITSPFACVACANPVEYVGAKPVFVDIDLETLCIDPSKIEKAINGRTRAIIPVHLFGLAADMDPILRIANKHRLKVIEDAALGLGAFYKGKHVGRFGDASSFSFHPRKMITTGEGGMVASNDENIDKQVKVLRNYGASLSAWDRHREDFHVLPTYNVLGFNYKMSDIHASLGVVQMGKLAGILERRREIAKRYDQELSNVKWLIVPKEPAGYTHAYQSYVCLFNPGDVLNNRDPDRLDRAYEKRNQFVAWLAQKGIATAAGARSIHHITYYKEKYGFDDTYFPNALIAEMLSIALPIYPQLSDDEQKYVIMNIKGFDV